MLLGARKLLNSISNSLFRSHIAASILGDKTNLKMNLKYQWNSIHCWSIVPVLVKCSVIQAKCSVIRSTTSSAVYQLLPTLATMKILQECKAILTLLGVGAEKIARINNRNIPRIILRCNIIVPFFICIYFSCVFSKNNIGHGAAVILMPIVLSVTFFFQVIVYSSLLLKTTEIAELMDFLENIVNQRNQIFIFFLIISPKIIRKLHDLAICLILGIRQGEEFALIYQKQDDTNNRITRMAFLSANYMCAITHIIPILCPLVYVCFGFPSPSAWYTPLGIHEAWVN